MLRERADLCHFLVPESAGVHCEPPRAGPPRTAQSGDRFGEADRPGADESEIRALLQQGSSEESLQKIAKDKRKIG